MSQNGVAVLQSERRKRRKGTIENEELRMKNWRLPKRELRAELCLTGTLQHRITETLFVDGSSAEF